jgi:hypothetical protein
MVILRATLWLCVLGFALTFGPFAAIAALFYRLPPEANRRQGAKIVQSQAATAQETLALSP